MTLAEVIGAVTLFGPTLVVCVPVAIGEWAYRRRKRRQEQRMAARFENRPVVNCETDLEWLWEQPVRIPLHELRGF